MKSGIESVELMDDLPEFVEGRLNEYEFYYEMAKAYASSLKLYSRHKDEQVLKIDLQCKLNAVLDKQGIPEMMEELQFEDMESIH